MMSIHAQHVQCTMMLVHSVSEVFPLAPEGLVDPSPPTLLPSKGRGEIGVAFRPDAHRAESLCRNQPDRTQVQ